MMRDTAVPCTADPQVAHKLFIVAMVQIVGKL